MDADGSPTDVALVSSNLGCGAHGSGSAEVNDDQGYLDAFERAALLMVREDLPHVVKRHGVRMLQHLLYSRKEELGSPKFANLSKVLESLDHLDLKGTTDTCNDPVGNPDKIKENNNHRWSLFAPDTMNNAQSLAATKIDILIRKVTERERNLGPKSSFSCGLGSSSDESSTLNETLHSSSSEEDDCDPVINNRDGIVKEFLESDPKMGVKSGNKENGSLLLMEHNILCQGFLIAISYSGIHQYKEILLCFLSPLNKIWTFREWKRKYLYHGTGLSSLFSDLRFLKMFYCMFLFWEEQLKMGRTEESSEINLANLLELILPLVLQMIQYIHALWDEADCNLSGMLERAKCLDSSFPFGCVTKLAYDKESFKDKETEALIRALLEGIRESGYNIIGLCTSIEDAFSKLLNGSPLNAAITEHLGLLEFRHLRKLIELTVIPLVKNCPSNFWKEWVDNLLEPLLTHCESILHSAWFSLLYYGRAGVPFYFGKLFGLEGKVKQLEGDILLAFTREVSGLLEVLASTEHEIAHECVSHGNKIESFQETGSMPPTSLLRYLVTNNCFGRLRIRLFGYFVDDEATAKAVPFRCALVRMAVASSDATLKIFIVDNLLPGVIQCLDNQLPCAIQRLKFKLNPSASGFSSHLKVLCQELHGFMINSNFVQSEAFLGEANNGNDAGNSFEVWLEQQKKGFREKAYSAAKEIPEGRWNWEFEDEFRRYHSMYIDMLQEVDAIDNCAELYMDKQSLFQKLRLEFRSKYAINSYTHPYMATISFIQQRKFKSMTAVVRNRRIREFLRKLIKLQPYIKGSDRSSDVITHLKQIHEIPTELNHCDVAPSVERLLSILFFWEPRYHPMIREAHMDRLLGVVDKLTASECFQLVTPIIIDFPLHLQPYAKAFVETKLEELKYYVAKEQIYLHVEFDEYLASGEMDHHMGRVLSSKDFLEELVGSKCFPHRFWVLDCSLIRLSFERRADLVHMRTEIHIYSECMQGMNKYLKRIENLIGELEGENYLCADRNLGKLSFSESIEKFNHKAFSERIEKFNCCVFSGHSLPKHYAIRGFFDCWTILREDISCEVAVKKVVLNACNDFANYLPKFWKETRYYEHPYYALVRDPLKQVIIGKLQ